MEYDTPSRKPTNLAKASLFEKKGKSQSQRGLVGRKDQIGKDSLLPLLEFFLNGKNFYGLRRWVSFLSNKNQNTSNT